MLRMFKMHVPKSLLILAGIEGGVFVVSFYVGLYFSWVEFGGTVGEVIEALPNASLYSSVLLLTVFSMGVYHRRYVVKRSEIIVRFIFGFVLRSQF